MKEKFASLMYHQTTSPPRNKYYVPIDAFREQVRLIKRLQMRSAELKPDGEVSKCARVLITFDDGHKSNLEAARILKEHNLKGYFFIVKDYSLHDRDYLTESQIKEIGDMGHVLAVHGKDHGWWTMKSDEQLVSELTETRLWLEKITGKPVDACAPPGGVIDERVFECIERRMPEFRYIRTVEVGMAAAGERILKTVPIHTGTGLWQFGKILTLNRPFYSYLRMVYRLKAMLRPAYNALKKWKK